MIRKHLAFALLISASAAMATEPVMINLDGGVRIALDTSWKAQSIPNMAMKLPSMRDTLEGASDTRIRKKGTGVMVTFIHFKTKGAAPESGADEMRAQQEQTVKQAAAQYLPIAVETEVTPKTVRNGELSISLATLHASEGKQFNVGIGYQGACVTTGSIRKGAAVHAISVASDSCDTDSHQQAVEAIYAAQT